MTSIYGSDIPSSVSVYSLYGVAFQYADKTLNQSKYTGDPGLVSDPEAANRYIQAVRQGEEQLDFVVYVPEGFGTLDGESVPNVQETDDPKKIFTTEFDGGQETWG
jgi:tRNA G37 N-methylase TrmD